MSVSVPSRRRFIKTFTLLSVYPCALGKCGVRSALAEIHAAADPNFGLMRLKLSAFPKLLNEGGAVRVGVVPITTSVRTPKPVGSSPRYPILISRGANDVFHAVSSRCSHEDVVVGVSTQPGQFLCPNHSSRYSFDGTNTRGPDNGPLIDPLPSYAVSFDGDDLLTVEAPNLGYTLAGETIETSAGSRIVFEFRAYRETTYELWFREAVADAWEKAPFTTLKDAPADMDELVSATPFPKIYADRTADTGFYAVAAVVREIL
jgi:Rieske Fe-S protein